MSPKLDSCAECGKNLPFRNGPPTFRVAPGKYIHTACNSPAWEAYWRANRGW